MKRITLLITGVMLAASLAACTPTSEKNTTQKTAPAEIQETVDGLAEKAKPADVDPTVTVCVYTVKEDKSGLKQNIDAIDGEAMDAQLLMDKMAELEVVESGIKVENFTQDGKTIKLNLSSLENSGDKQVQTAIANTFLQNFDADDGGELILTVGGEQIGDGGLTFNKEYKTFK